MLALHATKVRFERAEATSIHGIGHRLLPGCNTPETEASEKRWPFMRGTRWKKKLEAAFRELHREFRISLTPLVSPDKWVFVVGCYNTGTELLMTVLGTHPSVGAALRAGSGRSSN